MSGPSLATRPYGAMAPDVDNFAFSDANQERVATILARYPETRRQSAALPLLLLAQEQHGGWLPKAILDHVADLLGMPRIRMYEVASFYDMYNTTPVGPIQVRVCTTTPCWLCGSDDIVRAAKDELECEIGENSSDGRFFLREFECVGACANAPVLWVNDDYYEDLDYAKARELLAAFKRGETPKAGPQNGRQGSMPIGGKTTLFETAQPAAAGRPEASEEAGS